MAEDVSILADWSFRLEGAVLGGPEPIEHIWFPLRTGVHAFYGLNGAGKTTVLRALRDLLSGTPTAWWTVPSYLVCTAHPTPADAEPDPLGGGIGPLTLPVYELRPESRHPDEYRAELDEAGCDIDPLTDLGVLIAHRLRFDPALVRTAVIDWDLVNAQAVEVAMQHCVALRPASRTRVGSRDGGVRYDVLPAARVDPTMPGLWAEVQAMRNLDFDEDHLEPGGLLCELNAALYPRFSAGLLDEEFGGRAKAEMERIGQVPGVLFDVATERTLPLATVSSVVSNFVDGDTLADLPAVTRPAATLTIPGGRPGWERRHAVLMAEAARRSPPETFPFVAATAPPTPSPELVEIVEQRAQSACDLARRFMLDPPHLELPVRPVEEWFDRPAVEWAARTVQGTLVGLDALSQAQRTWAQVAIALSENPLHGAVLTFDEPDSALHATARRHLVDGLVAWAHEHEATVLCATHASEFLNHPAVHLHHVSQEPSHGVVVNAVSRLDQLGLDQLGLAPADAFLLHRVIIVVEGLHDELVLAGLLGDTLDHTRTLVLPLRGGRHLAQAVDSAVFARFSDAPVLAVLDNLNARRVQSFWDDMVNAHAAGESLDQVVRTHYKGKLASEEKFLIDYSRSVLAAGQPERFQVFGLSEPDVQQYLPTSVFGLADSWEALRDGYAADGTGKAFKPWLEARFGARFTEEGFVAGVAQLDHVPDDFVELAEVLHRLSRRTA